MGTLRNVISRADTRQDITYQDWHSAIKLGKTGRIREKACYMIRELGKRQDAFACMPGIGEGFLSGYTEEQFDKLEKYTPYPDIWAPYYTLHKILAGLLDCYELA